MRAVFAGAVIADTTAVRLVWEKPYYPTYYIPEADVDTEALVATGDVEPSPAEGDARVMTVKVGGREAPSAARWYAASPVDELRGTIRLQWSAMDAWFEEDEEVYVHPRDPYKRVDVLQSSRHVRIEVDGTTLADTRQPRMLFETGLPPRSYIPKTDVRMGLLTSTTSTTQCPYKGTAHYYAVHAGDTAHDDLAWWYQHPTPEAAMIAGYVCFYDERVDTYIDGTLQPRPRTPCS